MQLAEDVKVPLDNKDFEGPLNVTGRLDIADLLNHTGKRAKKRARAASVGHSGDLDYYADKKFRLG